MNTEYKKIKNSEGNEDFVIKRSFYISARNKLQNGLLQGAYTDFKKADSKEGCAYCLFLNAQIDKAFILLDSIKDSSPFVNWLLCLIGIIDGNIIYTPTYFQIRNFYENDINMLIKCKNFDYAKKICTNIDYLSFYNMEVFKYSARVFMDNGLNKEAIYFLKRSINIVYNDPEIHFMLADVYLNMNEKQKAKEEYKKSTQIAKGYYPAERALKKLNGL